MKEKLEDQLKQFIRLKKLYEMNRQKPNRHVFKDEYQKIAVAIWDEIEKPLKFDGFIIVRGYHRKPTSMMKYLTLYTLDSYARVKAASEKHWTHAHSMNLKKEQ